MVSFLLMVNLAQWEDQWEAQWEGWVMAPDLSWVDMDLTWADMAMGLEDLQCRFLARGLVE